MIVCISPNGEIESTVQINGDHGFTDGQILEGKLYKIVDDSTNLRDKWWDGSAFLDKPARPGKYYNWEDGAWTLDKPALVAELKRIRRQYLRAGDWTQLPDVTLTPEQIQAWRTYRQELRDLPQLYPNITHIDEVVWPTPPS